MLPCVVTIRVSFPFDEIPGSLTPFLVACDGFYLLFFLTSDNVRMVFLKVVAIGLSLTMR